MKTKTYLSLSLAAALASPTLAWAEAVETEDGVVFSLDTTGWDDKPRSVNVAGSFNGWNGHAREMSDDDGDGIWEALVELPDGLHQYKFVINGDRWITDPTDDSELRIDDNFGGQNSGVIVGPDVRDAPPPQGGAVNSEYLRHDPATDAVPVDSGVLRVRARALAGDAATAHAVVFRPDGSADTFDLARRGEEGGYDVFVGDAQIDGAGNAEYLIYFTDGDATAGLMTNYTGPLSEDEGPALSDMGLFAAPVVDDFQVPDWAQRAVWYQIFPERFRNGEPANDPGAFDYETLVPWNSDWWAVLPGETEPTAEVDNFYEGTGDVWNRRYGGDLQGLREKLPYLKELGVTAIYLNPIFEGESMHKYDTADFRHVDDNFGVVHDGGGGEYPPDFGGETDDPSTWVWSPSDEVFLDFLKEAKAEGFKVVIDGVFNHVGRAHPFFQDVLENGRDSRYADWFEITDFGDGTPDSIQYVAWDGPNGALPAFKKDAELGLAPGPRKHIFDITRRWLDPDGDPSTDDGIDGWRLDVPQDIPQPFWRDWRVLVKDINPDAYITGEIWDWAQPWLKGDQFDAVMNYRFAIAAQDFIIDRDTAIRPTEAMDRLTEVVEAYPVPITHAQQNLLASHDTDRPSSMIVNPDRPYDGANRPQDNARFFNGPAYSERQPTEEEWRRFKLLVAFQHGFVGSPMTYYGDEAGMWAPDDPSNRQPLPWPDRGPYDMPGVGFNEAVFDHYQRVIAARLASEALSRGSFEPVLADDAADTLAYARRAGDDLAYVVINRSPTGRDVTIDVEPGQYVDLLDPADVPMTEAPGERPTLEIPSTGGEPADGKLTITLPPETAAYLMRL